MILLASLLLFLLPFERIPSHDIAGVTVRLSSLVIIVFVIFGLPWLLKTKKFFPLSKIDWAILIYLGAVILSNLMAVDHMRSIIVTGLIGFVMCGYLLISRAFRDNFDYDKISKLILAAGVVTALFGLYQFFGDVFGLSQHYTGLLDRYTKQVFPFPRIQSVGLEPLYYANFLLFPVFILMGRIMSAKGMPRKEDMVMFLLLFWVFVLALSRGAYIGFLVGGAVFLLACGLSRQHAKQLGYLVGLIFLSLVLSYATIRAVSGYSGARSFGSHAVISEGLNESSSANPRIERFKEAIRLFKSYPIAGVGVGNFGNASHFKKPESGYEIVNNQYLESLAETGIVGFGALVALGVLLIAKLRPYMMSRERPIAAVVLLTTLIAIATQYNFFSTIYILFVWVVFGLIDAFPAKSDSQK